MLSAVADTTTHLAVLPGRANAERAIETALRSSDPGWLATVVADRVHLIYERCGYGAGDAVLEQIAAELVGLPGHPQIFRWTATSFVVMARRRPLIALSEELEATCILLPLGSVHSSAELAARLDHHVALRVAAA